MVRTKIESSRFQFCVSLCILGTLVLSAYADEPTTQPKPRREPAAAARFKFPTDEAGRQQIKKEWSQRLTEPPEKIAADRSAGDFPGSVPADAARVEKDVDIELKIPHWHSTGLYAPPGEVISVDLSKLPHDAKLGLRIGAHKDLLWDAKSHWSRFPEITLERPFSSTTLKLNNPFGGLVYIDVVKPGESGKTIRAHISGAVHAPLFVLGKTSVKEWQETISTYPGPWAEFATDKLILTVPSASVKKISDPTAVMQVWDQYLDACSDLTGRPHERSYPERMVFDRQISAGFLHSGYPIMGHLETVENVIDLENVRAVPWGPVHELGHNHQQRTWTNSFNVEVSCNFFPVYIRQTIYHQSLSGINALKPDRLSASLTKVFAQPREKRETAPFDRLYMYYEIARAFGWDKFTEVWKQYDQDPPKGKLDHAAENTEWTKRMSKIVGKNLVPYLKEWNFPANFDDLKELESLPTWMPEGFPEKFNGIAKSN